jgi:hypothetical protein
VKLRLPIVAWLPLASYVWVVVCPPVVVLVSWSAAL